MPRPPAQQRIVDPAELLDRPGMLAETHTLIRLGIAMPDTNSVLAWCARRGLIHNTYKCHACNIPCGLVCRRDITDRKEWQCRTCRVRMGSFLQNSMLPICSIIVVIYVFALDSPQQDIVHESETSKNTVCD